MSRKVLSLSGLMLLSCLMLSSCGPYAYILGGISGAVIVKEVEHKHH